MRNVIGMALLSGAIIGCTHSIGIHYPEEQKYKTQISIDLHGDVSFSEKERDVINSAALNWNDYSNGFASISVVYDLDFNSIPIIETAINQNTLVRVLSSTDLIKKVDEIDGGEVLGFVSHSKDNKSLPQRMILVQDRLEYDSRFYSVVLHEFGHLLWVPHTNTIGTLMYPSMYNNITCLTKEDMEEFCKANGCKLSAMKWCIP